MSSHRVSNVIIMFGSTDNEEYFNEPDTGDEPLWGQYSQFSQIGKIFTSHIHKAPKVEAQISHSWCLH